MGPQLTPPPASGRRFTAGRRVRLGDVTPGGRARFDALARYLQDVSSDDTIDARVGDDTTWVVRRTMVAVDRWPVYLERLEAATWCSGIGSRWAERRVSLRGDRGGSVDAATLWVHLGAADAPAPLPPSFLDVYGEAAGGRRVTSRLGHPKPPPATATRPWPLRVVDLDVLRHVNNAAYWAVLEEELARRRDLRPPLVAEMEHRAPVLAGEEVALAVADGQDGELWVWLVAGGQVRASVMARPAAAAPAAAAGSAQASS